MENRNQVIVKIVKCHELAKTPVVKTIGSAGADVSAVSKSIDQYGNIVFGTGLKMEIPVGYVGLLFPRSSVSKKNLDLANAVGVIDSDYRGEVIAKFKPAGVIQFEADQYEVGDDIAQLIIMPVPFAIYEEVDSLSETERGEGGFGHTDLKRK